MSFPRSLLCPLSQSTVTVHSTSSYGQLQTWDTFLRPFISVQQQHCIYSLNSLQICPTFYISKTLAQSSDIYHLDYYNKCLTNLPAITLYLSAPKTHYSQNRMNFPKCKSGHVLPATNSFL